MEVETNVVVSPAVGPAGKKTNEATGGWFVGGGVSETTVTSFRLSFRLPWSSTVTRPIS